MKLENRIVTIHQPSYFPWIGLLHKINKADIYIYLDDVQLSDSSFQHRNIFLSNTGVQKYLIVNTSKKEYRHKKISELQLSNEKWSTEHLNLISEYYKKHPFFNEILPYLKEFYSNTFLNLNDVLYQSMILVFNILEINTKVLKMSEMNYDKNKFKNDLVIDLINKSGCKNYLSGKGARDYMDMNLYSEEGILIEFQQFEHPKYTQKGVLEFVPGLSVLDMLFNEGIKNSQTIFKNIK